MQALVVLLVFLGLLALAQCGGSQDMEPENSVAADGSSVDAPPGVDAGADAAAPKDAGADARNAADAGRADATADADASRADAGPDGKVDAAADATDAAHADAEAGTDAKVEAAARDGGDASAPETAAPDAAETGPGVDATVDAPEDVGAAAVDTGTEDVADSGATLVDAAEGTDAADSAEVPDVVDAADVPDVFVATPPDAPSGVTATPGDGFVDVQWTAPADHGSAITGYTVTVSSIAPTMTVPATGTTAHVTGLTDGVVYSFVVTATNAAGESSPSSPAVMATPAGPPGAPTLAPGSAGDAQVMLTWTAPTSTGGSAIVDYTVTTTPADVAPMTTTATQLTISGLTNGTDYMFVVTARNAVGAGPASNTVSATPTGSPSAPTAVMAVPGDGTATVSWSAPASDGGTAITGYTVTASPGGQTVTATATSTMFPGLTNCTSYTFTVVAMNAKGTSPASAASAAVVPTSGTATTTSFAMDVQPIFDTNCTGCHGGSGGLTLSSAYANIVGVSTLEQPALDYVKPGDPGHSYLWCKVNPTDAACTAAGTSISGVQMPAGGSPLPTADLQTIQAWIAECAPNN